MYWMSPQSCRCANRKGRPIARAEPSIDWYGMLASGALLGARMQGREATLAVHEGGLVGRAALGVRAHDLRDILLLSLDLFLQV